MIKLKIRKIGRLCCTIAISFLVLVVSCEAAYQNSLDKKTTTLLTDNPLLASSFLGGSNNDGMYYTYVNCIQDTQGNIFISGTTESADFPTTLDSYCPTFQGNRDVFVTKMNSELTTVLASTYIGGSNNEEARGIEVDDNGDIFICGVTESSNFPSTPNAFQQNYQGGTPSPYGSGDAFIIKLNNDLTTVLSSTFLGGSGHEYGNAIDIDSQGDIIVTGGTSSIDFPITDFAFDKIHHSGGDLGDDVFISKLSNNLSNLLASTYVGGNNDDASEGIIVDRYDTIFVTGWIRSSNFPITEGTYDGTFNGGYYDGFILRIDNDLTMLQSSTFLGGSQWDFCYGITIDAEENVYVTGHTASTNFPVSPTAFCKEYQGAGGPDVGDDVFVSKLTANLTSLTASTYLGGDKWEIGYAITSSQNNFIYLTGTTSSNDFPITPNAFSSVYHGGTKYTGDSYLSCFNKDLSLLYSSTYLGETGIEGTGTLYTDSLGDVVIGGSTSSSNFPTSDGCYDPSFNGMNDVFIAKFNQSLSMNEPPDKPEISGPSYGKCGQRYEYTASTTDIENNQIYFQFDWGDGNCSDWVGPCSSGEPYVESYIWSTKGHYSIRVKAKDVFGAESVWSDPLRITIPYSYKPILWFLEVLFQQFPHAFPFLRHLMGY